MFDTALLAVCNGAFTAKIRRIMTHKWLKRVFEKQLIYGADCGKILSGDIAWFRLSYNAISKQCSAV